MSLCLLSGEIGFAPLILTEKRNAILVLAIIICQDPVRKFIAKNADNILIHSGETHELDLSS